MSRHLNHSYLGVSVATLMGLAAAFGACTTTIGGISGGQGGSGSGGVSSAPTGPASLPPRIRRITDAEFDTSVKALLGFDSTFGASFTPDARQDGFTVNDAQRVDPVFAAQLDNAAQQIASQARAGVATLAPCATSEPVAGEACARKFLATFAAKGYRRPPTPAEIDALIVVYHAGADGMTYADGIEAVVQAVLVSPGFLYVTEIGDGSGAPLEVLTPYETASAIAYLFTGSPPDDALVAAAAANALATREQRTAQARRLLALPSAGQQVTRVVEQWLAIETVSDTAKDTTLYPTFAGLRDSIKREADDFISQVMWTSGGTVNELLSADWTIADPALASAYGGVVANGRVSLTALPRRGILNQAAFLSVYAHAQETAPVLRGVAVLRRVVCIPVSSPTALKINVIPPLPDPKKTTRNRFDIHQLDPMCSGCHTNIDAFGFAFENFDAMGMVRTQENGLTVDSSAKVAAGTTFDGTYADSASLVVQMAKGPAVAECFARHVLKFASARSDDTEAAVEQDFVAAWKTLPPSAQGSLVEILVAWVGSDAFVQRRSVK